jgi:DNA-binding response OmpR family regulator
VHGRELNDGATDREAWFSPFHVRSSRQILLCDGEQVRLSGPAYNVLAIIDNAGEVVDRERLIARAWAPSMLRNLACAQLSLHCGAHLRRQVVSAHSCSIGHCGRDG